MRLPRNTVAFSGHNAIHATIISMLSLSLFMGAYTAPVPYTHAVTWFHAAEFDYHVQNGNATFFLHKAYGLPVSLPEDIALSATANTPAPAVDVRKVSLTDIVIGDLELSEPAPENTLRLLDLDKPLAASLSTGNAALDDFNNQLMISWAAAEFDPVVLDSFPRIPDVDSTQRSKLLPRMRRPGYTADPFKSRRSRFYLNPTNNPVKIVVDVDSTRNLVTIREVVNGKDVRIPITMSIQEYIKRRMEYERANRTQNYAARYDTTSKQTLEELMRDLTEFDIPIPPNPLMSIFGDRSRISLRINGQVDINAGFRIESSDQQSVFLRPTQFSPSFRQRVQINLNGLVGDKLSIKADWSTDRTFDYENELKVKYTGYEDEIIQSVEAGNVTLQTPSTLIQGSGALFGLKAEFLFGPLRLTAIASQQKGSSASKTITGGSEESQFERRAWDYSDSHFFIDVAYRNDVDNPGNGPPNPYEAYYNYQAYGSETPIKLDPTIEIKDIEVWVSRPSSAGAVPDPNEREGVAFINFDGIGNHADPSETTPYPNEWQDLLNPNNSVSPVSGEIEVGTFLVWERNRDYFFNPVTGILTLNKNIQDDQVVAVAYRTRGSSDDDATDLVYGTFSTDDRIRGLTYPDPNNTGEERNARLILKLVKPRYLVPTMTTAWNQKVRSIYSLNMRKITADDIAELKIVYKEGGKPEETQLLGMQLLRMFGLDYVNPTGGTYDNKIDFVPGITIDPERGDLIFPTLRPWDTGMKTIYSRLAADPSRVGELDQYTYPSVYDETKTEARKSNRDKIYITGRTRGNSQNTFQLGFNIVPGSVQVILNGTPLNEGTDYKVDENVGTITIMKQEALVPGADLKINYEKQDLFSFASKTLVGMRGDIDVGENSALGFTYLSLNQQTLSDKVRIGDEPVSNTMFGIDGRTTLDMPIITEALNTLPFLRTKEKSTFTAQGEFAMVMPGEDSKPSPIPSDGGKGIAYIDDFEGTRIFIPLQTAYNVWKIASVPAMLPSYDPTGDTATTRAQLINQKRAKLNWYNIPISGDQSRAVRVTDIWPDRQAAREDQRITILDLDYYPNRRGPYNYQPNLGQSTQNWAGIMRYLPVNATNLVDGNYNFIEIWMKVDSDQKGTMLIDLGKVSEDVIPDEQLQTEDAVVYGFNGRDGVLKNEEDVGLDMLTDAGERERYAAEIANGNIDADDPSGDNYAGAPNWDNFNGSEGNLQSYNGQFPDTEDLNKNSILDLTNEYFQFKIDLDSSLFNPSDPTEIPNPYVVGGGSNGWYQLRIPLSAYDTLIGTPTLTNVEFIRVLFTGVDGGITDEPMRVRIAEFNFVGNQWLESRRNDPRFGVTVVNIEDNPNEYTTPPGVIRPRDRTRPDQEIFGNEQSLSLVFDKLEQDSVMTAYRLFPGQRGLDLFNYERLKLYVHGDPDLNGTPYYFVLRFGIDDSAYYEYKELVYPGWDARNEVDIDFKELTQIKVTADFDPLTNLTPLIAVPGKPDAFFRVKGTPDVVNVRFIAAGVENASSGEISGEVWINEMRVVAPKLDIGYAYGGSASLRIADIADVNASMNYSDPNFHGISERFSASRAWNTNWSLSSTLQLHKAFPESWKGTQMRVSYSHTENVNKPLLMPGQPDVEVEEVVNGVRRRALEEGKSLREAELLALNARVATQTVRITDSWTIPTLQFKAPGEHWLVTDVFNKLTFGYNYTTSRYRDPTIRSLKRWEWNFNIGYGYEFGRDFYVQPFSRIFDGVPVLEAFIDAKWFYFPTRIGLSASLKRSRTEEIKREDDTYLPFTREFLHQRAGQLAFVVSENSLLNIDGSYNTSIQTSLLNLEVEYARDEKGRLLIDAEGNPREVQRQSSAIFNEIFFGHGGLYFGDPLRYDQAVTINSRPWIPTIFDLDRFTDLSLGYTVNYFWQTNLQQKELGRSAGFNSSSNITLGFRLKTFTDPWFSDGESGGGETGKGGAGGRRGGRQEQQQKSPDETPEEVAEREAAEKARAAYDPEREREALVETMNEEFEKLPEDQRSNPVIIQEFEAEVQRRLDSLDQHILKVTNPDLAETEAQGGGLDIDIGKALTNAAYYAIKVPLLDFDNINFTFSQTSASQVSGVIGETGFAAFWTTPPFGASSSVGLGPSRMYQLGLVSDPNPQSGDVETQGAFPFIGISNYQRGLRAPNPAGNYVDNYTQSSSFTAKTNRPLWEGANLDLTWTVRWSMNRNQQLTTDDVGRQRITSTTSTGQIERSYLSFPDFLFFSAFNTNIGAVNERFEELKADPNDMRSEAEKLAEAFEDGFEALPWLSDVLGSFMPRVNWGIRWDGLEKISFLEGAADRISLEHRYNSTLSSKYRLSPDNGARITESKRVESGFNPLLGATLGWDEILDGTMSLTARWNKTVGYNLGTTNIQQEARDEITMTANFRKTGFEMPFLGLTLKNDVEFSLAFSYTTNRLRSYEISNLGSGGQPREGTIQYTIEPRVRYSISSRVNASIFYRYQRTKPDEDSGSTIPGTTIHEAGLELKISISG